MLPGTELVFNLNVMLKETEPNLLYLDTNPMPHRNSITPMKLLKRLNPTL